MHTHPLPLAVSRGEPSSIASDNASWVFGISSMEHTKLFLWCLQIIWDPSLIIEFSFFCTLSALGHHTSRKMYLLAMKWGGLRDWPAWRRENPELSRQTRTQSIGVCMFSLCWSHSRQRSCWGALTWAADICYPTSVMCHQPHEEVIFLVETMISKFVHRVQSVYHSLVHTAFLCKVFLMLLLPSHLSLQK